MQVNSESVFLTKQGLDKYQHYQDSHNIKSVVIAKFDNMNLLEKKELVRQEKDSISSACQENDCRFILPLELPKGSEELLPLTSSNSFASILIDENHGQDIKGMIQSLTGNSFFENSKKRIKFGGIPYTNMKLDEYSRSIKEKLFPLFFVSSFILILILFKNIKLAAALFAPCLLSALISLSYIKFIHINSNLVLAIIPLMMFILNMSLLFHLFYTAFELNSFKRAIIEKKQPVSLMLISTFVGLISLYSSDIKVIQDFGVASSLLLVITSFLSLTWTYLLDGLHLFNFENYTPRPVPIFGLTRPLDKKIIWIGSLLTLLVGSILFPRVNILTNANDYFPKEEMVKEDLQDISKSFMGGPILDIIVETTDFEQVSSLQGFETELRNILPKEDKILSANVLTRFANKIYSKKNEIPNNKFAYQALLSQAPAGLSNSYSNLNEYRVTIFGDQMNVDKYEDLLSQVRALLNKHKISKYSFNGLTYHLMIAQKEMIFTLFKSFLGTLVIIALIALFLFKTFQMFFIILLVNTIPVFFTFIFYYATGISFNIATVMTFSISLGIIVDSTFHQIHALQQDHFVEKTYLLSVVQPIALSALTLSCCFLMFGFNPFLPIRHFGISLCFIILVGAFFDLKVLPTLMGKQIKS